MVFVGFSCNLEKNENTRINIRKNYCKVKLSFRPVGTTKHENYGHDMLKLPAHLWGNK